MLGILDIKEFLQLFIDALASRSEFRALRVL